MNFKIEIESFFKSLFFKLFLVFWIGAILLLFLTNRGEVVLFINKHSHPAFDVIIRILTELGHGTFAFLIVIAFLFVRYYNALQLTITLLLVSLFVNMGKRFLFFQHNRPLWNFYFDDFHRVIHEAPLNYMRSFPSGHTMTAFGLFTALAILYSSKRFSVMFLMVAIFVAFSRIYLCQHFFIDTAWGAILGVIAAILAKYISDGLFKLNKKKKLQGSLITAFTK